jgi:hypothetical protein
LVREIAGWEGVDVNVDRADRRTVQVRYGRIELGHLHGSDAAHLPFPRKVRDDLVALGHATPHPMLPSSGWVERRIDSDEALETVRLLFRVNYDRAVSRQTVDARRMGATTGAAAPPMLSSDP